MIRKYSKEVLEAAVAKSTNFTQVFENLEVGFHYGNINWLRKILLENHISILHFNPYDYTTGPKKDFTQLDISNGERLLSNTLRKFLTTHKIEYKCNSCGLKDWQGKKISLDVDHIDGNEINNSLDNLQYLCPNCHRLKTHSQFAIRKEKRKEDSQKYCECGEKMFKSSTLCKSCIKKTDRGDQISTWPTNEELGELVWRHPMTELAEMFGSSDNAVRKRCKKYKIPYPIQKLGYWFLFRAGKFNECLKIREKYEKQFDKSIKLE